ncbi:MAG: MFS transporter, partial [Chloroflexota bacterium]
VTRMFGGLGTAATIGIVFAMASTRYAGEGRLRALSIVSGSFSIAPIIGIPLLTTLSVWIAWRGAWVFVGGLGIVALAMVAVLSPADGPKPAARFTVGGAFRSYGPLFRSASMLARFAASAFQGLLFLTALTYNGAYFIDEIGISTQQFGIVAAVSGGAFALGSFSAGQLGRFDLRTLFGLSMVLAGFVLAPVYGVDAGAVGTAGLVAIAFFLGGISVVAILGLLADETPAGQGTTMVINEAIFSVGAAMGAALGGVLISLGGYGAVAFVLPVYGIVGGLLVWRPFLARSTPVVLPEQSDLD